MGETRKIAIGVDNENRCEVFCDILCASEVGIRLSQSETFRLIDTIECFCSSGECVKELGQNIHLLRKKNFVFLVDFSCGSLYLDEEVCRNISSLGELLKTRLRHLSSSL